MRKKYNLVGHHNGESLVATIQVMISQFFFKYFCFCDTVPLNQYYQNFITEVSMLIDM